jgi:hypothetical protein
MISVRANRLRIITAGSEPMRASGRVSLSQPRYVAHATIAGGVSERNPAKSPIRNAYNRIVFIPTCDLRLDQATESQRLSARDTAEPLAWILVHA